VALTEKLQILITADGRAAQQEFNKVGKSAEQSLGKTDDRLQRLSGQMVSFGATTLVAGGVAAAGLYKLASAAGDLEESQNKANVVLGKEGAGALEEYANGAAKAAGISKRAAIDAGSTFAVFGKSAGLSGQGLADFSVDLTQLAGDLASFSNTTTDEAIVAIGAALRGESEPIRQYGVLLDDATLKAEALEMGIYSGTGALSQQQRVLAAQSQILKQTTDAQGDFGRTSDSLANQQRQLAAEFENTKASIGEALLPAFQSIVGGLSGVTGAFNSLPDSTKTAAGSIAGIATAATIGVGGLSLLIGAGMKVADNFREMNRRIGEGTGPLSKLSGITRDADGNLTKMGTAARAAGLALATLVVSDIVFDALNEGTDVAQRFTDALNELKIAAGDAQGADLTETFAGLVAAEQDTLRFQNLWQEFGSEVEIVGTGIKADVEQVQRAFDVLAKSDPAAANQTLDDLEARTQDLDQNSRQYAINTEFIQRNRESLRLAAEAGEATAKSVDKQTEAQEDAADAADALKGALSKLSAVQKLANLQFEVGAKRAEAFGDSIERSTNADDLLASAVGAGKALRGLREQLGLVPAEADKAEDSTNATSETLERLADAAAMADPAVSELGISMDAASAGADAFNRSLAQASGLGSQLDAAVDLGEAFREVDRSARRLPKTLDLTGIALGELRPRQLDAIRDLRALGSATNEYLTALLKSGASADEVRKQAAGFRTELEAQLRQAGLTEDAIRQYVEAATLAPDQIETAIKLSGVEQARFKLNAYLGLLEGKIPPEVATSVITAIEAGDLDGAAKQLKTFADTNPVAIDLTPTGVDKLEEAVGTVADLPRVFDPLVAATGGYSDATLDALDSVLGLGDAYKDTLSQLASDDPSKAIDWAAAMREEFAKTVAGLNLTEEELDAYYRLLGIAPEQVETAVKISISDAELFALTTTIDLLTSIDSLSPEVQLQLSSALLEGDYEGVRALLESEVDAQLGVDPLIGEETYRKITDRWKSEQHDTKVGADTTAARTEVGLLYGDIEKLAPILTIGIRYASDAGAGAGYAASAGAARIANGAVPQVDPLPGLGGAGGRDGNIYTPFAKGGRFVAGTDALVGEEGPELVKFGAAGTVIPAGPTAALLNGPSSPLGDDKGQAALLDALRALAARMPDGDTQITITESVSPRATAEELVRVQSANRYLAGRS